MKLIHLLPALLLFGCAHSNPIIADVGPLPDQPPKSDTASVRTPEQLKAYPVGRYEDPNNPFVMHEGHSVYRAETSPEWNLVPHAPTSVPLGPTVAVADPSQQHAALTAELEQRLKQEDQLLQTTYEQNERLAREIKALQERQQIVQPPVPSTPPPVAALQPKPPSDVPSQPSPLNPSSPQTQKSWWQSLWPTQPQPKQKEK
jgi:hypothetical protein